MFGDGSGKVGGQAVARDGSFELAGWQGLWEHEIHIWTVRCICKEREDIKTTR